MDGDAEGVSAMTGRRERRIGLFAGTTEGRVLAEAIVRMGSRKTSPGPDIFLDIFVATEYGREGLPEAGNIRVFCGRLDAEEIFRILEEQRYDLVVDATHPYARLVSENIREACGRAGVELLRVLREKERVMSGDGDVISVSSVEEAVRFLSETAGKILVTTGSKELFRFRELPDWEERVYARVLSLPEVVSQCGELGFCGAHLIAMQGPFSVEMNLAILNSVGASWMVTKESGKAGGFEEKEEAARRAGAGLVVIGRPAESGISLEEAAKRLGELCEAPADVVSEPGRLREQCAPPESGRLREQCAPPGPDALREQCVPPGPDALREPEAFRRVCLVGTGPGSTELLTVQGRRALANCQLIAGAGRIVQNLSEFGKPMLSEYQPDKIQAFLGEHPGYRNVCVALSGDTGFYSGAKKLSEAFKKSPDTEVVILPGISSVNYFFARIGESWEDAKLLSLHGRDADLVREVQKNRRVFLLSGGEGTLRDVCRHLMTAGLADVTLTIGENLSLPGERIERGTPEKLKDRGLESLAVVLIENPGAGGSRVITHGLPDEAFLRDKVPMTKMEVRAVSVSRLNLTERAVVYDVGAGTGSVSIECARLSAGIRVYAVERNPEAVRLLYKNREKFGLQNLEIVEGTAPDALDALPAPSHVFIGGSGGHMRQVVEAVLKKNPEARFVINLITPESMAAVMEITKDMPVTDVEISQIFAARSKKAGESHLMMGQNPVWIVSFTGGT